MNLAKALARESILLVSTSPQRYAEMAKDIARIVSRSGAGIYVTLNKPFATLRDGFARSRINSQSIFFIDMVTRSLKTKRDQNCLYLSDPRDLTSVSIAIDQAIASMNGSSKFVFLDTVNTLLNYNNESIVIRFIHSLTSKMRSMDAKGILLTVGKGDERIISQLSQFCDKCLVI